MADLPRAESHDFGNLVEGEAREVVQIYNRTRFGLDLAQLVHQQTDFYHLGSVPRIGYFARSEFVEITRRTQCRAFCRQATACVIHQNLAHGAPGDGVEVLAALDLPTAPVQMPEPDFIDELGRRDRGRIALLPQMPRSDLVQLRKDLTQHRFRRYPVAC
jgi:hypothetical protein